MNKEQTYNEFWNSFGISAYDESTVSAKTVFPYITFNFASGDYTNTQNLSVSLWDRSTSWKRISELSRMIEDKIINMVAIPTDDGFIYISKGSPFAQRMADTDDSIRRIVLNVEVQFINN